jgi:hypothetical protein
MAHAEASSASLVDILIQPILKYTSTENKFNSRYFYLDRPCGLVVRVSGYRSRGPEFDSRPFQIFWEAAGLERGPLSLVGTTNELLEEKSSSSGLENRD